jgi:hypothetical protein
MANILLPILTVSDTPYVEFFRILEGPLPTLRDFMSYEALGRQPRRRTPEVLRRWSGISVYQTEEQARALASWRPSIGQYIATIRLEVSGPFRWEQTGDPDSGHHTLWSEPSNLLQRVVSVTPV